MCHFDLDKLIDICSKIIIPLVVGLVALLTYKVNSNKLKLDLYNRRFTVYESAITYYYAVSQEGLNDTQAAARIFTKHFREARFLFGKDSDVFKILTEFRLLVAVYRQSIQNKVDFDKELLKLEDALEPWLDFRNIARGRPTDD